VASSLSNEGKPLGAPGVVKPLAAASNKVVALVVETPVTLNVAVVVDVFVVLLGRLELVSNGADVLTPENALTTYETTVSAVKVQVIVPLNVLLATAKKSSKALSDCVSAALRVDLRSALSERQTRGGRNVSCRRRRSRRGLKIQVHYDDGFSNRRRQCSRSYASCACCRRSIDRGI
jgi:hypothetical protein